MSREYSPEVIASSFIKQFYEMLSKNPSELYRFYKNDSSFSHSEGNQGLSSHATGIHDIREVVEMHQLAGARLDLSEGSMDAQKSDNNGVFLLVTGYFTRPGCARRQFVQSFFLAASQNLKGGSASYFVRNSVFRLLESVNEPVAVEPSFLAANSDHIVPDPVPPVPSNTDLILTEATSAFQAEQQQEDQYAASTTDEVDNADVEAATVMSEPDYVNVSVRAEAEELPAEAVAPAEVAAPVDTTPSVPKSFADLVKSWGGDAATPAAAPAPTKKKRAPAAEAAKQVAAAPPTSSSLFVNQLPEGSTEADLHALFDEFGVIKRIDVHARGYAFVDYEESASVGRVLTRLAEAADAFNVRGTPIRVEERQAKPPAAKSAGGRGGRGAGAGAGRGPRPNGDKSAAKKEYTGKREAGSKDKNKK